MLCRPTRKAQYRSMQVSRAWAPLALRSLKQLSRLLQQLMPGQQRLQMP